MASQTISSRAMTARTFGSFQRSLSNWARPKAPSTIATAARKLKLWSAASREVGSMRPGSSFCRRSDGVSAIATVIWLEPAGVAADLPVDVEAGMHDRLAGGEARIGLDVAAHQVAVGAPAAPSAIRRGRGTATPSPCGFSNRSSGPVMPCFASIVACMPFCATSALATDFAAEIAPWRTTSGVGARAPLSASALRELTAVEPHQPRGHGRRREARHHDAVPVAVVVHRFLEPAVDLVADARSPRCTSRPGTRRRARPAASATGMLSLGWPPIWPLLVLT